jgi:hypothetical protein
MSEVTFEVSLQDIRTIACFLIDCADRADRGDWRSSHRHLTDFDHEWDNRDPDCDVIVIHPAPAPPKREGDPGLEFPPCD